MRLLILGIIMLSFASCRDFIGQFGGPGQLIGGSIQGQELNLAWYVGTFAGVATVPGSSDGAGSAAQFNSPTDMTTDGRSLFVADRLNHTIRRIDISTGYVSTLAGLAGVSGSTDGIGIAARFNDPRGITTDGANLYVCDSGNTIRRIVIATTETTTLAGTAGVTGTADGTGTAAEFDWPEGITTDGTYLYVVDRNNHTIRRIVIATAEVTTLAGTPDVDGQSDGFGAAARFENPEGITTDGDSLFIADNENHTIRKLDLSTGFVSTLAGLADNPGSANGIGAAAEFNDPRGITTDGIYLYVGDKNNHTIRRIDIDTAEVKTFAGSPGVPGSTDALGTAARFNGPEGVTTDGEFLYVADRGNHTIRIIR